MRTNSFPPTWTLALDASITGAVACGLTIIAILGGLPIIAYYVPVESIPTNQQLVAALPSFLYWGYIDKTPINLLIIQELTLMVGLAYASNKLGWRRFSFEQATLKRYRQCKRIWHFLDPRLGRRWTDIRASRRDRALRHAVAGTISAVRQGFDSFCGDLTATVGQAVTAHFDPLSQLRVVARQDAGADPNRKEIRALLRIVMFDTDTPVDAVIDRDKCLSMSPNKLQWQLDFCDGHKQFRRSNPMVKLPGKPARNFLDLCQSEQAFYVAEQLGIRRGKEAIDGVRNMTDKYLAQYLLKSIRQKNK